MHVSMKSSKVPFRTPFFYGWVIVAVSGLGLFFSSPGQTYSISMFINEYIREFGWSRTFVSLLYSAATMLSGLLLFFVGRVIDRYGGRRMSMIIGALLAVTCLWNSMVATPVMLFIGFFLSRYFGQGSMTLIPTTVVSQWFVRKRAFAFSLMSLGGVAASTLLPIATSWMIRTSGWQAAWRVWSLLLLVVFVPVSGFLVRPTPEAVGLKPDGLLPGHGKTAVPPALEAQAEPDQQEALTKTNTGNEPDEHGEIAWTLPEATKTRAFWLMAFCMAVPSMVGTGLTFHFLSILGERGINEVNAATVLGIIAAVSFPSTFLAGFVLDRLKVHHVVAVTYLLQAGTLVLLLFVNSLAGAILFGVLRGFLQGFEAISGNVVWPNYYGRKHQGSIRGFVMTILVIASALGPLPFGAAFDFFGGYTQVILVMMLFPALGAMAALLAPKPLKKAIHAESV